MPESTIVDTAFGLSTSVWIWLVHMYAAMAPADTPAITTYFAALMLYFYWIYFKWALVMLDPLK